MLRVLTAGESHGPELIAVMEGLPSGVPVSSEAIQTDPVLLDQLFSAGIRPGATITVRPVAP